MTVWYASKALANSIPAGSAGGAGTIGDPYDTIEACWQNVGFAHGTDVVICNGTIAAPQIYVEDNNGFSFAASTAAVRSFDGDSRSVIIESGGGLGVLQLNNTPNFIAIGVTLRATGGQSAVLRAYNAASAMNTILFRCKLDANGVASAHIDHDGHFRLIECELAGIAVAQSLYFDPNFAGTTALIDNVFNCSFSGVGTNTGITGLPQITGCHLITSGNSGTFTTAIASSNRIALLSGWSTVQNSSDTLKMLGDVDSKGWEVNDHSTLACTQYRSFNCSYENLTAGSPSGNIGLRIGQDGAGLGAGIDDVVVGNASVTNYNHGKMFGGGVTNAIGYGGNAAKCVISYLNKQTDATVKWVSGTFTNPISESGGSILYNKGVTGSTISNISGAVPAGYLGSVMRSGIDGATNSVNAVFKNNNLTFAGALIGSAFKVDAASTIAAAKNNYNYSAEMGVTDKVFDYQSATLNYSEWLTNETTAYLNLTNLSGAGEYISGAIDSTGHEFLDPPSIGSRELGISSGSTGGVGTSSKFVEDLVTDLVV